MLNRFVRVAAVGAAISAPIGAYAFLVRPWMRHWGVDATEAATLLPGDDLIAHPTGEVTRGITIEAAAGDVWPWLAQMGYSRAGWYSYDRLDMKGHSAREIHSDWQQLAIGDVVPTHPTGGFVVKTLEPGKSLTLYFDTEILKAQAEAAGVDAASGLQGGLALSGAVMGTQPSEFKASWTFVVTPTAEGATRLVERVRFEYPPQPIAQKFATEMFGFGVFLMMRKQMLEIRSRAQALAKDKLPAPYVAPISGAPAAA